MKPARIPRARRCVGDKQLHVWIRRQHHARLQQLAAQQQTTKTELVRLAVKAVVEGLV